MNKRIFKLICKILNMKKLGIVVLLSLTACGGTSIKEDAARYCDCVHEKNDIIACHDVLVELDDKYAFDPEGNEKVKEEIQKCLEN